MNAPALTGEATMIPAANAAATNTFFTFASLPN
jgi:hypothetical protein